MKKLTVFSILALSVLAINAAKADQTIQLGNINNNNCTPIQGEVMLLNSINYPLSATCSQQGTFPATDGQYYSFRLYTSVVVPSNLVQGSTFALAEVFTNNCARAQALFLNLNTPAAYVNPVCSPFIPKGYAASNGKLYDYKLTTYITVN